MNYNHFFDNTIILEDELVRLEPLEEKHYDALLPVAMHPQLWLYTGAKVYTEADYKRYFETALQERKTKKSYPFVYYHKQLQEYVGCTRYANIDFSNKKLEIGWTWLHPKLHGSGFNRHCKYLLLSYGFDVLQLNRVELKTSHLNLISQKAMKNIGAVEEGRLRRFSINEDGLVRDAIYFSFIAEEWNETKQKFFKEFMNS
ncbi:MAG: GNAT family N-acetyltransferase [Bacteroidetes bacterium]|nr:GNAT family N-acetyltransferase [Bacteroidota bacterium]